MIKSDRIYNYNKIELVIYVVASSIFAYKYVFWYIFYSVHIYFTLRTYNYHKSILKYSHNKKEMSKSIFKIKLTVQRNIQ